MRERHTVLFCLVASGLLAALSLTPLGPLHVFELKTLDLRFRLRDMWREPRPPEHVRVVSVDDATLRETGSGPRLLEAYAEALDFLAGRGVQAVGLKFFLAAPDSANPSEVAGRTRLIEALRRSPRSVAAANLPMHGIVAPQAWREAVPEASAYPWPVSRQEHVASELVLHPLEVASRDLALAAGRIGHVELEPDEDAVVRRVQLVSREGGRDYPSFVLQLVCAAADVPPERVQITLGRTIVLRAADGSVLHRIPIDARGRMLVNYRKREIAGGTEASRRSLHQVSLATLLRSADSVLDAPVRDRVVLLGATARTLGDFRPTPRQNHVPDLDILAEAAETILSGRYVRRIPVALQLAITWAFLLAGALLMVRLPAGRAVAVGLGLVLVYFVFEKAVFVAFGIWVDIIGPMLAMQAAVLAFPLFGYTRRGHALVQEMSQVRRFDDMVLHFMNSGLVATDAEGRVLKANARAATLLGRDGESLVGQKLEDLFDRSPQALEFLSRSVPGPIEASGGPSCQLQPNRVPVVFPLGGEIGDIILDLAVTAADALFPTTENRDGRTYVLTFSDVTEQVRLAAEDERRARLAAIGEVAAKLGHEIRNSLGGLRLYVENVREEIDPGGAGGRAIDQMVEEIEGLYRKIDELREYAREPVLDLSEVDLKQVLDEALRYTKSELHAKDIQVTIESQPRLPPLQVDRRQIREAFLNLIHNAIEAAPQGGHLRIALERLENNNGAGSSGSFLVHFDDDGPGIPPEVGDQVFSLFFTTKPDVGTGLGLPVVRKIVENHGGRVSFRSEPGRGTRFTLLLPPQRRTEGNA